MSDNESESDKEQTPEQSYDIGYGRPPKETQFKPGQSGNPRGRKRKPKSVPEQMQKVLLKKVTINEGGKTKSLSLQDVILRNLANMAAKGDLKAATFVFNLLNSSEFADKEAIDQELLSAEDQTMFEDVMKQLLGANGDGSEQPGSTAEENTMNERSAGSEENSSSTDTPDCEDSNDDDE